MTGTHSQAFFLLSDKAAANQVMPQGQTYKTNRTELNRDFIVTIHKHNKTLFGDSLKY